MPHMKALCDRAILLCWFEKKALVEREVESKKRFTQGRYGSKKPSCVKLKTKGVIHASSGCTYA